MNIYEFQWSSEEKKIARKAFEKAYEKEMLEIKALLLQKTGTLKTAKDIWILRDLLTTRRNAVDIKYDYRYSKLILVFSHLIKEGYLEIEDLKGLSEEKIDSINKILEIEKENSVKIEPE